MKQENNVITVIGATGKVGKELLQFLSGAGVHCRAGTRDLKKAINLPYVVWMQADVADKAVLKTLLAGTDLLYLATGFSENMAEQQGSIIRAAVDAGVQHIVKVSTKSAGEGSTFIIPKLHAQVEELLKKSGVPWTILQPASFMQNWLISLAEMIKQEHKIYDASGDGKVAFIDARDIAEVAFTVLMNPVAHAGKTYILTGGEAISYYDIADAIGKATGTEITYVPETPDEARTRMEAKNMPPWAVKLFLTMAESQRVNTPVVSAAVEEILSKPARNVYDFAKDYAAWFQ